MPEFSFNITPQNSMDQATSQALNDVLQNLQRTMNCATSEQRRLQEKVDQLHRENAGLQATNQSLREEVKRLKVQCGEHPQSGSTNFHRPAQGETNDLFNLERTIRIHEAPVHSVTIGSNAELVATASWDSTAKLYNLASEEVVRTLGTSEQDSVDDCKMGGLYAVSFSKTAPEILGCTSCDRSVYLWNHRTGKMVSRLTGHTDEVNGIDFHSSQQVMCTASDDCKVIIWDFQEGITLRTLDKHTKPVYGATFLGNEHQYFVATCCFDWQTRVFDMRDKQVVALLKTHTDDVIGIDYSSPKQLLATGSDDGLICLWDTRTWKLQEKISTKKDIEITDNEVKRVGFSPDGEMLAAACSSGRVLIYDSTTAGARLHCQLGGHSDCVFDVAWSTCPQTRARIVVSASHDHTCRYWREQV